MAIVFQSWLGQTQTNRQRNMRDQDCTGFSVPDPVVESEFPFENSLRVDTVTEYRSVTDTVSIGFVIEDL